MVRKRLTLADVEAKKAADAEEKRKAAKERRLQGKKPPPERTETALEASQSPAPIPRASDPAKQAAVDEAFALSYEPPSYHFGPNDDPYAEIAQRELCRRKLLPFIQRFRPKYMAGWVHEDICRRIERFVRQVEAILPPEEQIPGEQYTHGTRLRVYVTSVSKGLKGPQPRCKIRRSQHYLLMTLIAMRSNCSGEMIRWPSSAQRQPR